MLEKLHLGEIKKNLPGLLLGTGILVLCGVLAPTKRFLPGLLLIVCAVALYFWFSIFIAQKNWWDIRAVFSAIWLATIGLSSFRLTDYQELWAFKTWLCVAVAYAMFIFGSSWGISWVGTVQQWFLSIKECIVRRISFGMKSERLFWICFVVTIIGLGSFSANVAIRGYIPYFSSDLNAYMNFYTRFHIFSTASTMISGLSYYTLVTQKLPVWKKVFLVFSIVYSTFLFPMLVVSRGIFLCTALSLLTVVFYLHKKKLWVLILCTAITLVFYAVGTEARGYTEDELNGFFEPSKIVVTEPVTEPTTESNVIEQPAEESAVFQLSGSAAFVYTYLTVSHDNFDLAIKNVEDFSFGTRQLIPFNVILRMDWVDEIIAAQPVYLIRPHLNTINLVGDAYYDFGFAGVAVFMLIWAFAFGIIQGWYAKNQGIFSLMTLGITMSPVTLCFFSPYMSLFQTWMFWGLVLLMFLATYVTIVKKQK